MLFSLLFCLVNFAVDFEILEVEVVGMEDTAVDTVAETGAGIEVEGTEAFPCRLKEAAASSSRGFDKQNPAQGFLFVNSSHCCLN